MGFKRKGIILGVVSLCIALSFSSAAFAGEKKVSSIVLMQGKNADEELEKEGFNVVYVNLNKTSDGENNIYLGYSYGEDAITGVIVSSDFKDSITVDGIEYDLLSELNLNSGSNGEDVYLYYTKDEKAGSAVTSIDLKTKYAAGDEIILSYEDEYKVVLNDLGYKANLEDGKEGYVTYMLLSRIDDEEKYSFEYSDNSSPELQRGEERDQEVQSNKEIVDDETEAEAEAKEKALEEKEQEGKDDKLGSAVIFASLGAIVTAFVLVFVLKNKKGVKKNEK